MEIESHLLKGRFFHISKFYLGDNVLFVPRIPESRAESENETIARICFSRSIVGCLDATPADREAGAVFFVYSVEDIVGLDNDVVSEMVFDAKDTGEVWATTPCEVRFQYCIENEYRYGFEFSYIITNDNEEEMLTESEEKALTQRYVIQDLIQD
jgi:hypothetical protein